MQPDQREARSLSLLSKGQLLFLSLPSVLKFSQVTLSCPQSSCSSGDPASWWGFSPSTACTPISLGTRSTFTSPGTTTTPIKPPKYRNKNVKETPVKKESKRESMRWWLNSSWTTWAKMATPTYLPIYLSIYLSIHPSISLSLHPSIHLFIYPSIHPSIYLSIHPSIYLYYNFFFPPHLFPHEVQLSLLIVVIATPLPALASFISSVFSLASGSSLGVSLNSAGFLSCSRIVSGKVKAIPRQPATTKASKTVCILFCFRPGLCHKCLRAHLIAKEILYLLIQVPIPSNDLITNVLALDGLLRCQTAANSLSQALQDGQLLTCPAEGDANLPHSS